MVRRERGLQEAVDDPEQWEMLSGMVRTESPGQALTVSGALTATTSGARYGMSLSAGVARIQDLRIECG